MLKYATRSTANLSIAAQAVKAYAYKVFKHE
jgi:hypothetical protein